MRYLILTALLMLCSIHWVGAADQRPPVDYLEAPAEQLSLDPSKTDQATQKAWHEWEKSDWFKAQKPY